MEQLPPPEDPFGSSLRLSTKGHPSSNNGKEPLPIIVARPSHPNLSVGPLLQQRDGAPLNRTGHPPVGSSPSSSNLLPPPPPISRRPSLGHKLPQIHHSLSLKTLAADRTSFEEKSQVPYDPDQHFTSPTTRSTASISNLGDSILSKPLHPVDSSTHVGLGSSSPLPTQPSISSSIEREYLTGSPSPSNASNRPLAGSGPSTHLQRSLPRRASGGIMPGPPLSFSSSFSRRQSVGSNLAPPRLSDQSMGFLTLDSSNKFDTSSRRLSLNSSLNAPVVVTPKVICIFSMPMENPTEAPPFSLDDPRLGSLQRDADGFCFLPHPYRPDDSAISPSLSPNSYPLTAQSFQVENERVYTTSDTYLFPAFQSSYEKHLASDVLKVLAGEDLTLFLQGRTIIDAPFILLSIKHLLSHIQLNEAPSSMFLLRASCVLLNAHSGRYFDLLSGSDAPNEVVFKASPHRRGGYFPRLSEHNIAALRGLEVLIARISENYHKIIRVDVASNGPSEHREMNYSMMFQLIVEHSSSLLSSDTPSVVEGRLTVLDFPSCPPSSPPSQVGPNGLIEFVDYCPLENLVSALLSAESNSDTGLKIMELAPLLQYLFAHTRLCVILAPLYLTLPCVYLSLSFGSTFRNTLSHVRIRALRIDESRLVAYDQEMQQIQLDLQAADQPDLAKVNRRDDLRSRILVGGERAQAPGSKTLGSRSLSSTQLSHQDLDSTVDSVNELGMSPNQLQMAQAESLLVMSKLRSPKNLIPCEDDGSPEIQVPPTADTSPTFLSPRPASSPLRPAKAAPLMTVDIMAKLAHHTEGITRELHPYLKTSGSKEWFSGTAAGSWFIANVPNVDNGAVAEGFGQLLVDGEILLCDGSTSNGQFLMLDDMFYCLNASKFGNMLLSPSDPSLGSRDSYAGVEIDEFGSTDHIHVHALEGTKGVVLKNLVKQFGVDYPDHGGRTPLMYACIANQYKTCEMLLKLGANVNAVDRKGQTPLLWVAAKGHMDTLKVLLRAGADACHADPGHRTVLHWMARARSPSLLRTLTHCVGLPFVDKRDCEGLTALHWAVLANQDENIRFLITEFKANASVGDSQGRTALHYAVNSRSLKSVKAFLDLCDGTVLNAQSSIGCTALHLACGEGSLEMVKLFASNKFCDINVQDQKKNTPLHWACASNHPDIVEYLISRRCLHLLQDNGGKTPLQVALERNHPECAKIIREKTAALPGELVCDSRSSFLTNTSNKSSSNPPTSPPRPPPLDEIPSSRRPLRRSSSFLSCGGICGGSNNVVE